MNAQNTSFIEFQTDIPTAKHSKPDIGVKGGYLFGVDSNIKLGMGLGLEECVEFKTAPAIPLFLRSEFLISDSGGTLPFIDFDLGYNLNTENLDYGTLFINPMIGLRFNKVSIGVGYYGSTAFTDNSSWNNSISIRLGYNFDGLKIKKGNGLNRFLKKTSFGLDGSVGTNVGKTSVKNCYETSNTYEFSGVSDISLGVHWLYNIDEHWSAGIGGQVYFDSYTEKEVSSSYGDEYNDGDTNVELFFRGEYTHDEIANKIKPYADFDLGFGGYGYYISPQIGVKYDDKYRLGLSLRNRSDMFGYEYGGTTVNVNLGIDF